MTKTILEIRNLHAAYGQTRVLHGVDFSVEEGGVTTLLGANGAGKTTTLRAICGMVSLQGSILFDGVELAGKSTEEIVRFGIAHVPDGRGTFTKMTALENLQLGAMTRKNTKEIADDIERIFAYFPILKARQHQQAGTLSGGEQQMLAVGRALMLRPRLLLLDEPSFGLAPLVVRELFGILATINKQERVSILLVEQNASLALNLADHAFLIETGRIVMSGPSEEIKKDESVRAAYLGY